jgi:hypothetical protein
MRWAWHVAYKQKPAIRTKLWKEKLKGGPKIRRKRKRTSYTIKINLSV